MGYFSTETNQNMTNNNKGFATASLEKKIFKQKTPPSLIKNKDNSIKIKLYNYI